MSIGDYMKSLFIIILALGVSLVADSVRDGADMEPSRDFSGNELQLVHAILLHNGTPFTGVVTELFANGSLKSNATYREGKQHGIEKVWYENGQLSSIRFYENGKKVATHKGWWENGSERFVYHFVDGEHHGENTQWYLSGQIFQQRQYEHGKEVGAQKAWRENGKLYVNYVVVDGVKYGIANARLCYTVSGKKQ